MYGASNVVHMTRLQHLYVVEDDPTLREMLHTYFTGQGLEITALCSAEDMFRQLEVRRPELIVLDIALPGMSGLDACQRLRRNGDPIAIILLTARTDPVDRIVGLEMGADDYMDKPFSARELLARARAVLRRGTVSSAPAATVDKMIRIGEWSFFPSQRSLHRGQEVRVLNTVEYALLAELTATPGQPVTRERLLAASHANRETALLRAVDASIMRLRRLLESDPSAPRYIQTVRHHGYMFVPHQVEAWA
jgi:two-component system phosphate regulon response regulator OmpR